MKATIKNNIKIRSKAAFSLVEVMIAIMLTTVVLTSIYMVWSKVQRGIARSNTRQALQNELRKVANYMQNDFKSIKFDENSFKLSEGNNGDFSMSFEKFKETEDGKLAQDSTEQITYKLNNSMLTRSQLGPNILSLNCEGVSIKRAVDEISLNSSGDSSVNLESLNKDFKAGREAKLEIEISGKKTVPGTIEEMYHVEKTSIVMRNEYYKNTNKTYISNFDLTQKNVDEVFVSGNSDAFGNAALDYEYLITLNDDSLQSLKDAQSELQEKTKENLDKCDKQIGDTSTGQGFFGWLGDIIVPGLSEEQKVNGWRDSLRAAQTKDGVEQVKAELKEWTKDRKIDFLSKSTNGDYNRMSDEDKEIYRIAYDMKVQDRAAQKAYQTQQENTQEGDEAPAEPTRLIDVYKGQATMDSDVKDSKGNKIDLNTEDGNSQAANQKIQKVEQAYNSLSLDWMDNDEVTQDMNTFAAAESLVSQADTKLEILKMLDMYNENLEKIGQAWDDPKRPRN